MGSASFFSTSETSLILLFFQVVTSLFNIPDQSSGGYSAIVPRATAENALESTRTEPKTSTPFSLLSQKILFYLFILFDTTLLVKLVHSHDKSMTGCLCLQRNGNWKIIWRELSFTPLLAIGGYGGHWTGIKSPQRFVTFLHIGIFYNNSTL